MNKSTRRTIYVGVIGAMSFVLAKFTKFSIFALAPFLKLDFGEIPLLLLAASGDLSLAFVGLLLKEILSLAISGSNIFGLLADFCACGSFLFVFGHVLQKRKDIRSITLATLVGGVVRMVLSIPINLIILKLQFGTDAVGVWAQMPYILPFNLIKCLLGGACILYLYPRLHSFLIKTLGKKMTVSESK